MHQTWMVNFFNVDYVGRYPHMTKLWQAILVILASTLVREDFLLKIILTLKISWCFCKKKSDHFDIV